MVTSAFEGLCVQIGNRIAGTGPGRECQAEVAALQKITTKSTKEHKDPQRKAKRIYPQITQMTQI
jgi:hypothetical protein